MGGLKEPMDGATKDVPEGEVKGNVGKNTRRKPRS